MIRLTVEQKTALHRQRRFLILMSLAVIGYYLLGVSVKSEAQYSGFVLTLEQPGRAVIGLWIVWFWSLWRYVQQAYELLSRLWDELIEDINSEEERIALDMGRNFGNYLASQGKLDSIKSARFNAKVGPQRDGQGGIAKLYGYTLDGKRIYKLQGTLSWEQGAGTRDFDMELSPLRIRLLRVRAWIQAILRLPAFNDHIAPLLISAGAVIAWLWSTNWGVA